MTLADLLKKFDEIEEAIKKTNALLKACKLDLENELIITEAENIIRR